MDFLKPPLWREGDFLEPQHLQYLNLHIRANSVAINNAIFDSHGIHDLQINMANLKRGTLEVNKLTLILKNGEYINVPSNTSLLSRSFADHWKHDDTEFNVYIGLLSVSEEHADAVGSVVCKSNHEQKLSLVDLYDENNKNISQVNVLKYHVELFWENELADKLGYSHFRLLSLKKNNGAVNISDNHYPSLANILCYPPAVSALKKILHNLENNSVFFTNLLRDLRKQITLSIDAKVLFYMQLCKSISYYMVHLRCLLDDKQCHPRSVYLLILQCIEELLLLPRKSIPHEVTKYSSKDFAEFISDSTDVINKTLLGLRNDAKYFDEIDIIEQQKVIQQKEAIFVIKLRALNNYKVKRQEALYKAQKEASLDVQLKSLNKIKTAQYNAKLRQIEEEKQQALAAIQLNKQLVKGLSDLNKYRENKLLEKQRLLDEQRQAEEDKLAAERIVAEKKKIAKRAAEKLAEEQRKIVEQKRFEEEQRLRHEEEQKQKELVAATRQLHKQLNLLNSHKVEQDLLAKRRPTILTFSEHDDDKWLVSYAQDQVAEYKSLYLMVTSDNLSDKWLNQFVNFSKLAAGSKIDMYIRYSLDGIAIEKTEVPQNLGYTFGANTVCFHILVNSEQWKEALSEGSLVLYAPDILTAHDKVSFVITKN